MLLDTIASFINRNIAASSRARELSARLEGRSLGVTLAGPMTVSVQARIEQAELRLSADSALDCDVTIHGTPLALLPLLGPDARTHLQSGKLGVQGDAEIAQGFHELLRAARPELEEELSRLVGDVAAHQIGNVMRAATGWGRKSAATFADNVAEFLQEESRDLVSRTEADEFNNSVDELREAADRLGARLDLVTPRDRSRA